MNVNISFDDLFEQAKQYAARVDASGVAGQPAVYEAVLTGEDGGTISAVVCNDRISVYKGPYTGCLCSVTTSPQTIADILTGKLNPMTAIVTGRIKVRGDMSALMRLKGIRLL